MFVAMCCFQVLPLNCIPYGNSICCLAFHKKPILAHNCLVNQDCLSAANHSKSINCVASKSIYHIHRNYIHKDNDDDPYFQQLHKCLCTYV